jgi:hypothetical protein
MTREYVGGPRCGDPVKEPGISDVTIARPVIGKTARGRGTYVYEKRGESFVLVDDVGVTS